MESSNNFKKSSPEDLSIKPEKKDRKEIEMEIKKLEKQLSECSYLEQQKIKEKIEKLIQELGDDDRLKRLFQNGLVDN
ncbi:MAG: hypothetical protein PHT16_00405 [Candidatus Pacebacteria bacterium]|nr:hypothetical protein [Candidatus Paceibacterota bacterium]